MSMLDKGLMAGLIAVGGLLAANFAIRVSCPSAFNKAAKTALTAAGYEDSSITSIKKTKEECADVVRNDSTIARVCGSPGQKAPFTVYVRR